jgi:hypothetical protein
MSGHNNLFAESENNIDLRHAVEASSILGQEYPQHSWHVRCDGGVMFIRCMSVSGTVGMARHTKDFAHDAQRRKHDIIMAAGELLERAHLKRKSRELEFAKVLEGADSKGLKFRPIRDSLSDAGIILPEGF